MVKICTIGTKDERLSDKGIEGTAQTFTGSRER